MTVSSKTPARLTSPLTSVVPAGGARLIPPPPPVGAGAAIDMKAVPARSARVGVVPVAFIIAQT
ncbi:hypothetical protein ES703_82488 [subsurface metagenome]